MTEYQTAATLLVGMATAIVGWLYARRTGIQQAEKRLQQSMQSYIDSLEERLALSERLRHETKDDCDRRLAALEERWRRWAGGPIG